MADAVDEYQRLTALRQSKQRSYDLALAQRDDKATQLAELERKIREKGVEPEELADHLLKLEAELNKELLALKQQMEGTIEDSVLVAPKLDRPPPSGELDDLLEDL